MPHETKRIGDIGEAYAASHLEEKGYTILERNWRFRRLELDLIAMFEDIMVFVEVKTRDVNSFYKPERSVTRNKWDNIAFAAGRYMEHSGHDWEIRFDLVSVLLRPDGTASVRHFEDVFFPDRY